jgi:hypothetical protein
VTKDFRGALHQIFLYSENDGNDGKRKYFLYKAIVSVIYLITTLGGQNTALSPRFRSNAFVSPRYTARLLVPSGWFTGFRFDLLLKVHPFAYDWAEKMMFIEWFTKQVDVNHKI